MSFMSSIPSSLLGAASGVSSFMGGAGEVVNGSKDFAKLADARSGSDILSAQNEQNEMTEDANLANMKTAGAHQRAMSAAATMAGIDNSETTFNNQNISAALKASNGINY